MSLYWSNQTHPVFLDDLASQVTFTSLFLLCYSSTTTRELCFLWFCWDDTGLQFSLRWLLHGYYISPSHSNLCISFLNFVYVSSYFRWHWAFAAACGLSLVAESGRLGSSCGVRASHRGGFSHFSSQGQELWHRGLAALQHVGSPQIKDRTCVPCTARQTLNHWATKEAPNACAS